MGEMNTKKYFIGADLIRVLSGFGVVLIHVTDPFLTYPPYLGMGGLSWLLINITNTAFRMSVPLFIMLSGYLLLNTEKEMNFNTFYKKRFLRVVIPFVFWVVFYFLWQHFFLQNPMDPLTILQKLLFIDMDHLYFLFIIVELYFVTPLLYTFLKNTRNTSHLVLFISSSIFTLGLYIINNVFPDDSVKTQENILTIFMPFISYYVAGYFLPKFKVFAKYSYYSFLGFMGLLLFSAFASEGIVNSFLRSYGSLNIMLMSFLTFVVIINIDDKKKLLKNKTTIKFVKNIAATIFGVYLVHMIVIDLVDKYLHLSVRDFQSPMWNVALLKTLLVFAICYAVVKIGQRIPYVRAIFG